MARRRLRICHASIDGTTTKDPRHLEGDHCGRRAITWRTRAKRRYVTHPRDYLDPLSKPVTEQDIERALAEDPPPF